MLEAQFRAYIDACSRHDWATARSYFGDRVVVNDEEMTADAFVGELVAQAVADPGTRWTIVTCRCTDDAVVASLLFENGERHGVEHAHYRTDGSLITALRIA